MARWIDALNAIGNGGACRNAERAVEARRQAEEELERFLARVAHPAGGAKVPRERRVA